MSSGATAVLTFTCEYISTQKPSLAGLFEENRVLTRGRPMLQPATGGDKDAFTPDTLGEDQQQSHQFCYSLSCAQA